MGRRLSIRIKKEAYENIHTPIYTYIQNIYSMPLSNMLLLRPLVHCPQEHPEALEEHKEQGIRWDLMQQPRRPAGEEGANPFVCIDVGNGMR